MKSVVLISLCLMSVFGSIAQAACWERKEYREIEGFSELDNKLILSFKDAVDCKPLESVSVTLGKLSYITDARGYVSLPMDAFMETANLNIPMSISKLGYASIKTKLKLAAGTVLNKRMLLSPTLAGNSMRFILQWNEEPADLDLHLEGQGFHVSYRNMKAGGEATLDQDEQKGFGPETITLNNVKQNQYYKLSVVNYSADAEMDETAKVLVYIGNRLDRIIPLNETENRNVGILAISGGEINQLQTITPSTQAELIPGW